jgi:hypothetical protein
VGGLVFVSRVVPVRFTISPSSEHAVARVIEELTYLRYVEMGVQDNAVAYRKGRLPRILLWEEGHIRLTRDGDDLVVNGPSSNLRAIRKHLLASK